MNDSFPYLSVESARRLIALKKYGRPIIASRLKIRHLILELERFGAANDLNDLARDLGLAHSVHDQR